jgi:hypothetical protein
MCVAEVKLSRPARENRDRFGLQAWFSSFSRRCGFEGFEGLASADKSEWSFSPPLSKRNLEGRNRIDQLTRAKKCSEYLVRSLFDTMLQLARVPFFDVASIGICRRVPRCHGLETLMRLRNGPFTANQALSAPNFVTQQWLDF